MLHILLHLLTLAQFDLLDEERGFVLQCFPMQRTFIVIAHS